MVCDAYMSEKMSNSEVYPLKRLVIFSRTRTPTHTRTRTRDFYINSSASASAAALSESAIYYS
jgi:hypothetical protein